MTITSKIKTSIRYCLDRDYRDYRYVRTLHVFDSNFFFKLLNRSDTDFPESTLDPLWFYFQWSKDNLDRAAICSRIWMQIADPHPLFDTAFYLSRYRLADTLRNPFAHYLRVGWKKGWSPSPYFDPNVYRQRSGWRESDGDPLTHYTHLGAQVGVSPGQLFDIDWYLDKTPFLINEKRNIIKHYKLYDAVAGKSPVPLFEPETYLAQTEQRDDATDDPMAHYICAAEPDGIKPSSYFDPVYYRSRYMGGGRSDLALSHYLSSGVHQLAEPNQRIADLEEKPVISLVVPVYNTEPCLLNTCIRSVLYQAYPHWELCLVDDCSSDEGVRELIRSWAAKDQRIKFAFNSENCGITAASQKATDLASGKYLGFLDHDDELALDCLYHVAAAINETAAEVIYTDESLIGDDGSCQATFFKPDYNLELLYSHNYITHFVIVSTELFKRVGGLTEGFDGAQDYELMLRLAEQVDTFYHIPRVLYKWRAIDTSTSISHENKPYAHEAGKRALQESINRRGLGGVVEDASINFHYRLSWPKSFQPSVTIVYCNNSPDRSEDETITWLDRKTSYQTCRFEIISPSAENLTIEGNGSAFGDQTNTTELKTKTGLLQDSVNRSDSDYIAFLGAGADDLETDWLQELIGLMENNSGVGIVCGRSRINGGDGPSYLVPDLDNDSAEYFSLFLSSATRHENGLHNMQRVPCCDWQICLVRRTLLAELGGFDGDNFPKRMAMLDLSYRAHQAGVKILYTPYSVVRYNKSNVNGNDIIVKDSNEKKLFQQKHHLHLQNYDSLYNPGPLVERGISLERFYTWLSGNQELK